MSIRRRAWAYIVRIAYEPWVDTDGLFTESVWVLHSEDRCRFASLIAASDFNGENSG